MDTRLIFVILCVFTYMFTFFNGLKDGPNAVATIIASRSMRPGTAFFIAAAVEFFAPFLVYLIGFSVAETVAKLIDYSLLPEESQTGIFFIASGIVAAMCWDLLMIKLKMPSSSSHSLIGSLIGAGIAAYGFSSIDWQNFLLKVVLVMFAAPLVGFAAGWLLMKFINLCTLNCHVKVNNFFMKSQVFNMVLLSANHSLNDSQKSIGVIMLLSAVCLGQSGVPPLWPVAAAGAMLALGITFSGYRIIKTVGSGIYRVRPKHSFASQLSSSLVILASSLSGAPVSASQIVSSSIMGIGAAQKVKEVRWITVKKILISWFTTIPASAVFAALIYCIFNFIAG